MQILTQNGQGIQISRRRTNLAVGIPCSNETVQNVLKTLDSVAQQRQKTQSTIHRLLSRVFQTHQTPIIISINNSENASDEVKAANQKVFEAIKELWRGNHEIQDLTDEEVHQAQRIIQSNLEIIVVDLFSERHAPVTCNIGIALNSIVTTARKAIDAEGAIAWLDADSYQGPGYLKTGELLLQETDHSLFDGEVRLIPDPNYPSSIDALYQHIARCTYEHVAWDLQGFTKGGITNVVPETSGTNVIVRLGLYEQIGQYDESGKIDPVTDFFSRAADRSPEISISKTRTLKVTTTARASSRAVEGGSFGGRISRLEKEKGLLSEIEVPRNEHMLPTLVRELQGVHGEEEYQDFNTWLDKVKPGVDAVHGEEFLTKNQWQSIFKKARSAKGKNIKVLVHDNLFNSKLRQIISSRTSNEKIPLQIAVADQFFSMLEVVERFLSGDIKTERTRLNFESVKALIQDFMRKHWRMFFISEHTEFGPSNQRMEKIKKKLEFDTQNETSATVTTYDDATQRFDERIITLNKPIITETEANKQGKKGAEIILARSMVYAIRFTKIVEEYFTTVIQLEEHRASMNEEEQNMRQVILMTFPLMLSIISQEELGDIDIEKLDYEEELSRLSESVDLLGKSLPGSIDMRTKLNKHLDTLTGQLTRMTRRRYATHLMEEQLQSKIVVQLINALKRIQNL